MRAVVIGTGFGAAVVAPVYEDLGIQVDLVSPRDAAAVRRACAAPVDLVSVHSPPFLHREHVLLALEHGRNVHCDKPFGTSGTDAREMFDAASSAGVIHLLDFQFRQDAARLRIKELLDEGAVGTPTHVSWSMFSSAGRAMSPGWLFDGERGGGWVGAYGSHVIDTLRWWLGEVREVTGVVRTEVPRRVDDLGAERTCTAEDAFSCSFTFVSGAVATVDTAFAAAASRPQRIEVFGSHGMLSLTGANEVVLVRPEEADRRFDLQPVDGSTHPAFRRWAGLVRDAIREDRQIEPSFRDGLACAVLMQQLRARAIGARVAAEPAGQT